MDSVAFEIFGISIRWYGIILATAMAIALVLATQRSKDKGYGENTITDLALVVMPSAIIGARAYYVLFELDQYGGDIMKMINIRLGGLAIHGGLIGGLLAGIIYTRIKKLNTWQLADIIAPPLILAQSIGRWGNYINREAHGGPTDLPWGIMVDGVKVHPTFLYESLWNLAVFAVLMWLDKHKTFNGETVCWYMILYSIGRFFIEGLRTDSLMIGPLRMAQLISIAFIAIGSAILIYQKRRASSQL